MCRSGDKITNGMEVGVKFRTNFAASNLLQSEFVTIWQSL